MWPILLIPHYNRRELLGRVLAALKEQTVAHSILVIDNGSTDGSAELAESHGAQVLRLDRNYGFAYAVNRGIEIALRGDSTHVGIVNNDVVPASTWLAELIAVDAPFTCGKIVDEANPGVIDGTFDLVSRTGLAFRAGHGQPVDSPIYNQPREILSAPMTAALFRREVLETVGLLDESFGSYLEDIDYGIRCAVAGFRGRYVPTALATHRGSATLGTWHPETVRLLSRNQIFLVAKHSPRSWLWSSSCYAVVGQLLWGVAVFRRGEGAAYLRGKREGVRLWHTQRGKDAHAGPIFEEHGRELRSLAPNRFWKVIAWIS